nr:MAG TPA: PD-(D/E)XK nuclease superfamily protein [Caudoviricetes sp.]
MIKTYEYENYTLEFDDEAHRYIVNGIITPSVSKLLSLKFDDYPNVPKAVLQAAADRGTEMHKAIEVYEKTGKESDLQEFRNYLFLKKHFKIENVENELPVAYFEDGLPVFAGTIDQVCRIDGVPAINDFKRVSAPNKEKIAYQVNLYRLAYNQTFGVEVKALSFMQLRESVRKFTQLPINEEVIKAFLAEVKENV